MDRPQHIIINRTDSIGDVVLTMPLAGYLKSKFPAVKISFLGKAYTQAIIELSCHVDHFLNWDEIKEFTEDEQVGFFRLQEADWIIHVFPDKVIADLANKAGIPNRVGTNHRLFLWRSCNHKVNFTRKRSQLHEAQLNFKLLEPLTGKYIPNKDDIAQWYGFTNPLKRNWIKHLMDDHRYNLILHPKSQGSAREWGLDNFSRLIEILPQDRYKIFVTATKAEAAEMKDFLEKHKGRIDDVTAQFTLEEFISLISYSDGLVAASTGPLHIAAALGKKAVGLYAPMRPIHPGRWEPLGKNARTLVVNKKCNKCKNTGDCQCIRDIKPGQVVAGIEN